LTISREAGNRNLEARALNNIGAVYGAQGRHSEAETFYERALEIREKVKSPVEMADTLHNLAETLTKMGRYDQALQRYVRALEVRRGIGDKRATAIESYGIGTLFDSQGRYGAAVNSKQDALSAFRELKLQEAWLSEILGGLGGSLSLGGRMGDAAAPLDEALALAKELNNHRLVALALRFQSARLYFTGDPKGALQLAERAVEAANASADRAMSLSTQAHLTLVASASQPAKTHAATLATLAQQADSQGLQSLAVECSIQRADVLARSGDAATALPEVDRALARAETLGLRVSLAKAHYVKASILRARGDAAARAEYASTLRLLEQLRADDGNQDVLKRADLAVLYAEADKWSKVS
jgi:tetratricopeptide (TPR) repeat protein